MQLNTTINCQPDIAMRWVDGDQPTVYPCLSPASFQKRHTHVSGIWFRASYSRIPLQRRTAHVRNQTTIINVHNDVASFSLVPIFSLTRNEFHNNTMYLFLRSEYNSLRTTHPTESGHADQKHLCLEMHHPK